MWFNPFVRKVLQSPIHFLISGSTMLIHFQGRKSGRSYSTPVNYLEADGVLLTISSRDRVWWKNLRGGQRVSLLLKGREVTAEASVAEEFDDVAGLLSTYLCLAPQRAKYLKIPLNPNGTPREAAIQRLAQEKVVVKFQPLPATTTAAAKEPEMARSARRKKAESAVAEVSVLGVELTLSPQKLAVPAIVMLAFLALGTAFWRSSGMIMPLLFFGYIGLAVGLGLGLYTALPKQKKPFGRRLSLLLVGLFLMGFAAIQGQENMQLEGVFFSLLAGVTQAAVIHYLIAKVFGPMLFGRIWCGWACWTVMVLDLLPFKRPAGRLPGKWGWLRYLHFAVSLAVVLIAWFAFGFRDGSSGRLALVWYVSGNLFYYALGVVLAFALKDNRAFCKYVCPVSVPLKITSRFALLKISGQAERCNDCRACVKMCPMDIRIPDYILEGKRVLSTECSLCQTCLTVCARDALKLSFSFDVGGEDLLRERQVITARTVRNETLVA